MVVHSGGSRHGLGGQCPQNVTVKHTGQESRGEFCECFKFRSFL